MTPETLELNPSHHALLFAYLAREAIRTLGQIPADDLLRHAVRRYGWERGRRMAQRALAHGHELDWASYLAYREWAAPHHPHAQQVVAWTPQYHVKVLRCPWNDAWQAEDLGAYGRYYCRDVDRAIVQGFSPELELSVSSTLAQGDRCCEFVYVGYALDEAERARLEALQRELGTTATMPWEYHLGHLYWTLRRVFAEHTGAAGEAIADRALKTWEQRFGIEAAQAVRSYAQTDFLAVPDACG